jgi:large subunit ribosomal protein L6
MSRIAKYPVEVPKGVEVMLSDSEISVKGPLGTLKQFLLPSVNDREGRREAAVPCRRRRG